MTSPLKAELQRNPLESNFLAPTFLASSVLLDLIRLPEWGRGDDFCKVGSLTALQVREWYRHDLLSSGQPCWLTRWMFPGYVMDVTRASVATAITDHPQVYHGLPLPNVESQSPPAKKVQKAFSQLYTVSQPYRVKSEQKRLDSWLSASVSDHPVTSSDHARLPSMFQSCPVSKINFL